MIRSEEEPERANLMEVWCPYFLLPRPDAIYAVCGFCAGGPGSVPMIPGVQECSRWCCTADHTACPIYRSRHARERVSPWLREQQEEWALHSLGPPV